MQHQKVPYFIWLAKVAADSLIATNEELEYSIFHAEVMITSLLPTLSRM